MWDISRKNEEIDTDSSSSIRCESKFDWRCRYDYNSILISLSDLARQVVKMKIESSRNNGRICPMFSDNTFRGCLNNH